MTDMDKLTKINTLLDAYLKDESDDNDVSKKKALKDIHILINAYIKTKRNDVSTKNSEGIKKIKKNFDRKASTVEDEDKATLAYMVEKYFTEH